MSEDEFEDLVTFVSLEKHRKMENVFKSESDYRWISFWSAGDDEDVEGKFVNWYSRIPIPYIPWAENRPHADGTTYNHLCSAVILRKDDNGTEFVGDSNVRDYSESEKMVTVCTAPSKSLKFKLRGLCSEFSFDREYVYTVSEQGQEMYLGRSSSILFYNKTTKLWNIYNPKNNASLITSTATWKSFLLGKQQVSFSQASEENCYEEEKIVQPIKLTSCAEGYFTCNDGMCVPMEKRCDQTPHCQDESDENDCKLIIMKNYNKNIAPFSVDKTTEEVQAVKVFISAKVIDILDINEVAQSFQVKFTLLLSWYDHRLIYHNLKHNRLANSPTLEEVAMLWIPGIIFDNTEHNDVLIHDNLAKVTVSREGKGISADETIVDEVDIFKGSENKLTLDKSFTKTVKCIYQLQLYPFDTQVCTINLQVGEYERKIIEIIPESILMESDTLLTKFLLTHWKLEYKKINKKEVGIHIKLVLKRRINNAILTIYLPTILILIIVYSTNFFKDFFFEAVVTVNLTSLLVLTTLFISVSQSLPPTAYVKMIDVWLIFAQMVPFMEVLLHSWMDLHRINEDREINHHGKSIKPEDNVNQSEKVRYWKFSGIYKVLQSQGITVVTPAVGTTDLVSRNEEVLVEARKEYYRMANQATETKNQKRLQFGQYAGRSIFWFFVLMPYYFRQDSLPRIHCIFLLPLLGVWSWSLLWVDRGHSVIHAQCSDLIEMQ